MDSSSTHDLSIDLRPLTTTKNSSHNKNDNVDENTVASHRLSSIGRQFVRQNRNKNCNDEATRNIQTTVNKLNEIRKLLIN